MRYRIAALCFLVCSACRAGDAPAPAATPAEHAAAAPGTPQASTHYEALPRVVAGVSLGVTRSEAEAKLGPLSCRDTQAGYLLCTGAREHIDDVTHLELYIHHDHVISLSYEGATPADAFALLDRLTERYGHPSLSGVRKRDHSGRLHEVYGWKDDDSLYSVRFIWHDTESGTRDLVGTAFALWDRKGYQQWEAETQQQPTPTTSEPNQPA